MGFWYVLAPYSFTSTYGLDERLLKACVSLVLRQDDFDSAATLVTKALAVAPSLSLSADYTYLEIRRGNLMEARNTLALLENLDDMRNRISFAKRYRMAGAFFLKGATEDSKRLLEYTKAMHIDNRHKSFHSSYFQFFKSLKDDAKRLSEGLNFFVEHTGIVPGKDNLETILEHICSASIREGAYCFLARMI